MKRQVINNPFRIHGVVEGEYFTDRTDELQLIMRSLTEPGNKLLVYGPRRMGKTSAILNAVNQVNNKGGHAFLADLSTASNAFDMCNRILAAATKIVGKKWKNFVTDIISRLNVSVSLTHDPVAGLLMPSIDMNLRGTDNDRQRRTLSSVLDAINDSAKERKITIGIVLDEFQEIHKFGGETAEWDLRGTIQYHGNIGYILAGSREHLIRRMIIDRGSLYKLVDKLPFGPIDPDHLTKWINLRMKTSGARIEDVGEYIIRITGPRTRDVIQVARKCYDQAVVKGRVTIEDVEYVFNEIVAEENDLLYSRWNSLTLHQQNVLRAVAAGQKGLTTQETIMKYSLGPSGTVSNTATALVKAGYLVRDDAYTRKRIATPTGYDFDSPFFKAWVIQHTLSDIGLPQ